MTVADPGRRHERVYLHLAGMSHFAQLVREPAIAGGSPGSTKAFSTL